MSNRVNIEGVSLLEQPFVRVPYENYRKIFRTSQKYIEKDFSAVQSCATDLKASVESANKDDKGADGTQVLDGGEMQTDEMKVIENTIERVENLSRKLTDLQDTSGRHTLEVMRGRFTHLADVEKLELTTSPEFVRWAETRLDRWLVDWCLRHGKERTARQLAKEKGIETLVDIELFTDIRRIEDALSRHSCSEALAWCSENKAALRKMKSTLEFELRLQEYIELARARNLMEAIAYARKHLVPWSETHLTDILHANALIAFDPKTTGLPYKRLYDPSRWTTLTHTFRLTAYSLHTLPTEPLLHLALYAGLAALKSPSCFNQETKNVDCPVCDSDSNAHVHPYTRGHTLSHTSDVEHIQDTFMSVAAPAPVSLHRGLGLGKLAQEVPLSHHANSTIVCRITGKIMDEDNMPMVFPDGQVYSREAMEEMAARNDGFVTCPKTGTRCEFSALRKVFIS